MTFIDLFAGCGGLSLGLEESNFKSVLLLYINNRSNLNPHFFLSYSFFKHLLMKTCFTVFSKNKIR